uniref:Endonuclease III homolog n=1 Tax=Spongospora subterranea TaxID=70186 RepID=A0A0H5QPJ6_9EUKA|eukprot:CRZ03963.1 hypothetical protein [Spongospora subterranea]
MLTSELSGLRRSIRLGGERKLASTTALIAVPAGSSTANVRVKKKRKETDVIKTEVDMSRLELFNKQWQGLLKMRASRNADVDLFGAEALSSGVDLKPKVMRYHALIAVMLSSQTRDPITAVAMNNLKAMKGGLTVETINETSESDLKDLIYGVGFYNRKAKFIKETTRILSDLYDSDLPNDLDLVCSLPGCGQKMAKIALRIGWGNVCGISVDTHVHRVARRIGWSSERATTPEKTAAELESWVPRQVWDKLNLIVVGFGQQVCKAPNPSCESCLIKDLCERNGIARKNVPKKP